MADNSQAAAAMREGMADAQRRIDFYGVRPGQGVPAGTTGSDRQRPAADHAAGGPRGDRRARRG